MILARNSGTASTLAMSFWIASTMAGGVPAGANRPYQEFSSRPEKPCSLKVATLGKAGIRCVPMMPSALSLPALIRARPEVTLAMPTSTRPAEMSPTNEAAPL